MEICFDQPEYIARRLPDLTSEQDEGLPEVMNQTRFVTKCSTGRETEIDGNIILQHEFLVLRKLICYHLCFLVNMK